MAATLEKLYFAVGADGYGIEVAVGSALGVVDVEADVGLDKGGPAPGNVAYNRGVGLRLDSTIRGLLLL